MMMTYRIRHLEIIGERTQIVMVLGMAPMKVTTCCIYYWQYAKRCNSAVPIPGKIIHRMTNVSLNPVFIWDKQGETETMAKSASVLITTSPASQPKGGDMGKQETKKGAYTIERIPRLQPSSHRQVIRSTNSNLLR